MASNLTTELKDLDVDRVDGVDRPATGRAFALFKSEKVTKETTTMATTTLTDAQVQEILKNYASVATAADMLLKALRKDSAGKVSKSTAIAVNGLAQIMGADPVFVSKAVPTQPYEYSEPDVDKRGPADENLGANFTPRSMPGSMVGKVQFAVKGADATLTKAGAPMIAPEEEEKPKMPWEQQMSKMIADGVADGVTKAFAAQKTAAAPVAKAEKVEKTEGKPAPESKQVMTDEQRVVRKNQGYRFGESFEDLVFGKQGVSAV